MNEKFSLLFIILGVVLWNLGGGLFNLCFSFFFMEFEFLEEDEFIFVLSF